MSVIGDIVAVLKLLGEFREILSNNRQRQAKPDIKKLLQLRNHLLTAKGNIKRIKRDLSNEKEPNWQEWLSSLTNLIKQLRELAATPISIYYPSYSNTVSYAIMQDLAYVRTTRSYLTGAPSFAQDPKAQAIIKNLFELVRKFSEEQESVAISTLKEPVTRKEVCDTLDSLSNSLHQTLKLVERIIRDNWSLKDIST